MYGNVYTRIKRRIYINMKYIITENKLPIYLLRRLSMIKDRLEIIVQNLFDEDEMPFVPFEHFLLNVSDYVATDKPKAFIVFFPTIPSGLRGFPSESLFAF